MKTIADQKDQLYSVQREYESTRTQVDNLTHSVSSTKASNEQRLKEQAKTINQLAGKLENAKNVEKELQGQLRDASREKENADSKIQQLGEQIA